MKPDLLYHLFPDLDEEDEEDVEDVDIPLELLEAIARNEDDDG